MFGKRYKTRVIDPSYANARDVGCCLSQMIYAAEHEYFLTHPNDSDIYEKLTLTPEHLPENIRKEIVIMKQNGETREGVAFRLHMSDNTLREWLNNPEGKIKLDFIITITLMWKIPEWISKLLIDRAMI